MSTATRADHSTTGSRELADAIMLLCMTGESQAERVRARDEMHELIKRFNIQEPLSEAEKDVIFAFLPRFYRACQYGMIDERAIEIEVVARLA